MKDAILDCLIQGCDKKARAKSNYCTKHQDLDARERDAAEDLRRGPDAEPEPTPGEAEVTPLVIADLQSRSDFGARKYGTRLQTFNGRDALKDAYQEALDLCCYLRQRIEEEERLEQKVTQLEGRVEELEGELDARGERD